MPHEPQPDTFDRVIAAIDLNETDPERHLSLQMDSATRDAIRTCRASGKAASVAVTIKVTPDSARRVKLHGSVKATLPRPPVSAVTLYTDDEGGVHHSDPAQLTLPHTTKKTAVPVGGKE